MSGDSEPQKSQEPQPIESMCEGNNEPVATTPIIDGKSDDKEARKAAFKEFIKSIPRTCSPTICGTVGCPSPGISRVDADCSEEWHTQEFNWSIDQIAILNPCDISLDEQFNGELTNLLDSSLERENEQFFEQLEILPSPAFCRLNLTPGDGQGSFLTPFTRLPPGNRSTPYQPCTPPPTRSASRTARLSSASSTTPYSSIKTKNKKKLFNDNQDDIFEDSESNVPMCSIDPETAPFSLSLSSP
uniref:Uncharacterized protein n=1 Tax=Tetranychus urticae TaxID=32264 RepID=T1K4S1_TETUR